MITGFEKINRPQSGEYKEINYSGTDYCVWVKFIDENYDECCGVFASPVSFIGLSNKNEKLLVLSNNELIEIDANDYSISSVNDQYEYTNATMTPDGRFIVSDKYSIFIIETNLQEIREIDPSMIFERISFDKTTEEYLVLSSDITYDRDDRESYILNYRTLEYSK